MRTKETKTVEMKSLYTKRKGRLVKIGEVPKGDLRYMSIPEYYEWLTGHPPSEYESTEDMLRYFRAVN